MESRESGVYIRPRSVDSLTVCFVFYLLCLCCVVVAPFPADKYCEVLQSTRSEWEEGRRTYLGGFFSFLYFFIFFCSSLWKVCVWIGLCLCLELRGVELYWGVLSRVLRGGGGKRIVAWRRRQEDCCVEAEAGGLSRGGGGKRIVGRMEEE